MKALRRIAAGLALTVTASTLGGVWYGRYYLTQRLTPTLEQVLSSSLQRPVKLGPVIGFSSRSIHFGASSIPPTPQHSDFLVVDRIEIEADLQGFLQSRQLEVSGKLIRPHGFLLQSPQGVIESVPTTVPLTASWIDLQKVDIVDGRLTLGIQARRELITLDRLNIASNWNILNPQKQSLTATGQAQVLVAPWVDSREPEVLQNAVKAHPQTQGRVKGSAQWDLTQGQGQVQLRTTQLQLPSVVGFLPPLPVKLLAGKLNGDVGLRFLAGKSEVQGALSIGGGMLQSPGVPQPLTDIAGNLIFDGLTATLQSVSGKYGNLTVNADGTIGAEKGFDLAVAVAPADLAQTLTSLDIPLPSTPLAGEVALKGKITGKTPALQAVLVATQPITVDQVVLQQTQVDLATQNFQDWQLLNVSAQTDLGEVTGRGLLDLKGTTPNLDLTLSSAGILAEAVADRYRFTLPIPVGRVSGQVHLSGALDNLVLKAQGKAPEAQYPIEGSVTIRDNTATLDYGQASLPEGIILGSGTFDLPSQRWQAKLSTNRFNLPQAMLQGTIALESPTGSWELSDIRAQAAVQFPQGVAHVKESIQTTATWNGQQVAIDRLTLGNLLTASGEMAVKTNEQQQPIGLGAITLQVNTQDTELAALRPYLPSIPTTLGGQVKFEGRVTGELEQLAVAGSLKAQNIRVEGNTDLPRGSLAFDGNIAGSLTDPLVKGTVELTDLAYQNIAFDPLLTGTVQAQLSGGVSVDLAGEQDKIAFQLDQRWQPKSIAVQLQQATALAKPTSQSQLAVRIDQFPIGLVSAALGQPQLAGTLSGEGVVSLGNQLRGTGKLQIDRPQFGRIQADRLAATIEYQRGNTYLRQGTVAIALPYAEETQNSLYQFDLAYTPQAKTRFKSNITVTEGEISEIARLLQWNQWEDIAQGIQVPKFAKAAALLSLPPVGLPKASLQQQLNYISQIQGRLIQQEVLAAEQAALPPLSALRGGISGKVQIQDTTQEGLAVQVDLKGKQWEYGKLAVDALAFEGSLAQNMLTIGSIRLQSGDSKGELTQARLALVDPQTGKLGSISGDLSLQNFPIESLRPLPFFRAVPVEVTGKVNGVAQLGGNLLQPQGRGQLELKEGTISQQPIDSIRSEFDYALGRLKFSSTLALADAEPMKLSGNIPFQVGYVFPGTNLNIDLEVSDTGLAFVNLISPTVRWLEGKGNAKISVRGTTRKPQLVGVAELRQGVIQVAGLPGNITDFGGKLQFDFDRVNADVTGRFSEGKVTAKGVIPISDDQLTTDSPLLLDVEKLKLDLKDTYTGNFDGKVTVGGSLQNPLLSGMVALSEGRIALSGESTNGNGNGVKNGASQSVRFQNLNVQLAENIQISRAPLLNFLGKGQIEVNGNLEDLRPSGKIALLRGQVNAISARFRLDRSYDSFAEFIPSQGLDPNLNVRVLGAVPEVTRPPIEPTPFDALTPGSIPVSNLGAQRTLQVQATVTGRVSNPSFELRSSPPRTQSEILALIGGGLLVQTGGDPTATLVNLAGGTVISFLQDAIGDVLNLSEFNLSPVATSADGRPISALGLAAEGAFDIGRDISLSLRSVINDPSQTTSYTLRYRLNPNTLIRTNTDFKGTNSTTIEFENRF